MGYDKYNRVLIILFLVLVSPLWASALNNNSKKAFELLNGFISSFPTSFVAEISSEGIKKDIEKIPKLYIKDNNIHPKLLIFFSKEWGIKIWMDNVAKGIAKQYMVLSQAFESFFPFLRARSFKDFSNIYDLESKPSNKIAIREIENTKKMFYLFKIEPKTGKILSISKNINGKIELLLHFEYKKVDQYYVVNRLFVEQFDPKQVYHFSFINYDIRPHLAKEDFLG